MDYTTLIIIHFFMLSTILILKYREYFMLKKWIENKEKHMKFNSLDELEKELGE